MCVVCAACTGYIQMLCSFSCVFECPWIVGEGAVLEPVSMCAKGRMYLVFLEAS